MRLVRLVSIVPFAFALLAACGGGDNPELFDANVEPDATPVPPDAGPPDACGDTYCEAANACVDTTSDSQFCGDCDTACSGGTYCDNSLCVCPAAFVPANPAIQFSQSQAQGPATGWFGVYGDPNTQGVLDVLVVAYPTDTVELNHDYILTPDTVGQPPLVAAGYDVDIQNQSVQAAVYATGGTLVFTSACAEGVSGTVTLAHFDAVDSLQNPVIVEGGCSFDVPLLTFSYGSACP
jgi:hypothetical protein